MIADWVQGHAPAGGDGEINYTISRRFLSFYKTTRKPRIYAIKAYFIYFIFYKHIFTIQLYRVRFVYAKSDDLIQNLHCTLFFSWVEVRVGVPCH